MKVLLLFPEFPDTFWSFKHALKFVRKRAASPPLGLLTIAAMLPANWQRRLVDLNVAKLSERDLQWADLVMISAMGVQKASTHALIERCHNAGLPVVAGGPLFTCEPEEFPEVDHLVLNEAELTLPLFLRDWQAGQPKRIYNEESFADIRKTPLPAWELADLRRYVAMSIQYSRGCPFQCDFCNVTALFGHQPRTKSASQVITELDALYSQGWRDSVFFVDDNFIGHKQQLKKELLPALIAWQQNHKRIAFYTEVSINLADDPELVKMMVEAGFDTVFIGIETPHDASLAESSKHHNQQRNLLEDVKSLQRAGLEVQGGFIVGFDNDPPSIFQRQIEFIQKSGIVTAMVGLLQAPPGTRLYERLLGEDRLRGDSSGNNVSASTNIVPAMGLEKLQKGYRELLVNIYAPRQYYQRLMTFLREYRLPQVQAKRGFQHKMAFFRAAYHLGIIGKERIQYWKVMIWTLFTRPRLLPLMVTLAIYGHHFRKTCEKYILPEVAHFKPLETK